MKNIDEAIRICENDPRSVRVVAEYMAMTMDGNQWVGLDDAVKALESNKITGDGIWHLFKDAFDENLEDFGDFVTDLSKDKLTDDHRFILKAIQQREK